MPVLTKEILIATRAKAIIDRLDNTYDILKCKSKGKEFISLLERMPVMLMQNGVLQTMIYLKTKNDTSGKYESLYQEFQGFFDNGCLIEYLMTLDDMKKYAYCHSSAIELSVKLKQIAVALKQFKDDDDHKAE